MERALEIIRTQFVEQAEAKARELEAKRNVLNRRSISRFLRKKRIAELNEKIGFVRKRIEHLESKEFEKRLSGRRFWALEHGVETGENSHLRILRGYANPKFKQWVMRVAEEHGVSENEVWAGVLETIRKAQWEVVKHVVEKHGFKKIFLPLTVIHRNPRSTVVALTADLRGRKPVFNREKVLINMGVGALPLISDDLRQAKAIIDGDIAVAGSSLDNVVGLNDTRVRRALTAYMKTPNPSNPAVGGLLGTIARETILGRHPQKQKLIKEKRQVPRSDRRDLLRVKIEDKYLESKESATEMLVEKHEEIFEPLMRRLRLKSSA